MMLKSELRKIYLDKRKKLTAEEVDFLSREIAEKFILQFNPIENQSVHCFLPIEKFREVNTNFIINACFERNVKVYIPKMIGNTLISVEYHSDMILAKNKWGIQEPLTNQDAHMKAFDYVISPLLYSDNQGNRVGYGKGFYDKLFTEISPKSKKIGVSFFPPNEEISDIWEEDIPLDYLVCPEEILSFTTDKTLG